MNINKTLKTLFIIFLLTAVCMAQGCDKKKQPAEKADSQANAEKKVVKTTQPGKTEQTPKVQAEKPESKPISEIDKILAKLNAMSKTIETYQCQLLHLVEQPLFESQSLRTGKMCYLRKKGSSRLRVDLETIKVDDEPIRDELQQFFFNGHWLTVIDHPLKQIKKYELVDPNKVDPDKGNDAFDLISEHMPIVGFTGTDKLKQEFDISLVEPRDDDPNDVAILNMKVKKDSLYKDNWVSIEFTVDKKLWLPVKMVTLSTEEDIYGISFVKAKLNEKLPDGIFNIELPKGFTLAEQVPLKRNSNKNNK